MAIHKDRLDNYMKIFTLLAISINAVNGYNVIIRMGGMEIDEIRIF